MVDRLDAYFAFADAHPSQFVNPPGGITILLDEDEIREAEATVARRLEQHGMPREWAQVGIVYEDQYGLMLRDAVRFPNGSLGTYIRSPASDDSTPGVVILPRYQDSILLLRHFRHATRTWHLEAPRGYGLKGLASAESAQRELHEEIKATVARLVPLGSMHPDTGLAADCVDLFYAEIDSYGDPEIGEGISEIMPVTIAHFKDLLRGNEITDGYTLAAYARAQLFDLL